MSPPTILHGAWSEPTVKRAATTVKRRLLRRIGLSASDLNGIGQSYLDLFARAMAKVELMGTSGRPATAPVGSMTGPRALNRPVPRWQGAGALDAALVMVGMTAPLTLDNLEVFLSPLGELAEQCEVKRFQRAPSSSYECPGSSAPGEVSVNMRTRSPAMNPARARAVSRLLSRGAQCKQEQRRHRSAVTRACRPEIPAKLLRWHSQLMALAPFGRGLCRESVEDQVKRA